MTQQLVAYILGITGIFLWLTVQPCLEVIRKHRTKGELTCPR